MQKVGSSFMMLLMASIIYIRQSSGRPYQVIEAHFKNKVAGSSKKY